METVLEQLISAIKRGEDDKADWLCQMLTSQAEPRLIALASDRTISHQAHIDPNEARWWSIRALALCGGAEAIPLLRSALQDVNDEIRAAAALAIGQIYSRLDNSTSEMSAIVAPDMVGSWAHEIAPLLSDEEGFVRQAAADALVLLGNHSIEVLGSVLGQTHPGPRVRAAYALRKINTMETVPLLFQYLNDANYLVHTYAHEALDELGMFDNVLVTL
ncbi:MAG: HEAT repeat domain-containing protein [Chloroflexota bacterium]